MSRMVSMAFVSPVRLPAKPPGLGVGGLVRA